MSGNQSNNAFEPLFYIIQPKNRRTPIGQNMQEVYHSKMRIDDIEEKKVQEDTEIEDAFILDLTVEETVEDLIDMVQEDLLIEESMDHEDEFIETINQSEEELNVEKNTAAHVEDEIQKKDLRLKLIRLARYPAVIKKPFCELKIDGEVVIGQIESKRGELLKVKIGDEIKLVSIDKIEEVSFI